MQPTCPTPPDHDRLIALMVDMAEGDHGAVFPFIEAFGPDLARMIRGQLRGYGRLDLIADPDEIDALVQSAAFEILDRAGSWDPAGAPPWVWAAPAIRGAVAREIGNAVVALDVARFEDTPAAPAAERGDLDLDDLARRDRRFGLFRDAIAESTNQRDRDIALQYLVQQALGDPSPSSTVAAEFDVSPANVRQIVCRARRRVRRLQADDARYHELGRSGWLAA